jgi:hypothetical protein
VDYQDYQSQSKPSYVHPHQCNQEMDFEQKPKAGGIVLAVPAVAVWVSMALVFCFVDEQAPRYTSKHPAPGWAKGIYKPARSA